jgi:integrase
VNLRRSKTDQEGAGRVFGVHRGLNPLTCPLRALQAWLKGRGRWAGPLFCPITRGKQRVERCGLRPGAIAEIVQTAAVRVGLDASRYAGHSLRAGCATAAAQHGAGESAIMERTGHRSAAMVRRYIRHGTVFARNPLDGVL